MNWVGGSRSRIILKQERRKQKEYFEKKKLRSKMKLLGVSSPSKSSTVSLDLLNLYVVNQIATKKDNADRVRKPVHVDMNRGIKAPIRRHNIELPMSPQRTSSKIGLDDIQNRIQKQVLENRRKHVSDKVKYQPQLSQVMESTCADYSLKHQYNLAADCNSYPVSSSVSWSSNYKRSPEQNFRRNLACSSWELADEEKPHKQFLPFFQLGNICPDPWVSKSQNRQCIFSKSNTAMPLGTVFKKMNSPEYINSVDSTSGLITGKDSGSSNKIKEPFFGILQETAAPNDTHDESGHCILALSEDERQLIHNIPSMEYCSTFANQGNISQLFTDPDDRNEIFNRCSPYDTREIYNVTKCTEMYTADRCLKEIFTGPEQTFFISKNISCGSHKENKQPNKDHLKEYHEGPYLISSENQDNPSKFERTRAFTNHNHKINLEEKMQNYSTVNNDSAPLEQSTHGCSQVLGFEEVLTAEEEQYNFEVSSKLGKMEKDIESSLSSQSPTYSPKQTDSSFCTSSEMSEEDEPAEKKCLSDSSFQMNSTIPIAASTSKGLQHSFCTESVLFPPCTGVVMKEAITPEQKEPSLQAPEEENKDHAAQPQHISSDIPFKRMNINRNGRCDAWSQTQNPNIRVEKLDTAIQCDIIQACCCRNNLSSVHSAEILSNASKAENTGGQEIPADEAFQSSSTGKSTITAEFPPETEYLTLPDKMTVGALNYINIMKKEQLSTKENY
ncbi:regulator of DNA class I crossover intermediates 1 [Emydura macquarii macquarii]|uniref:regulator of DNA class I crossover intermediates 1 n=1 Tax=Emydura macquarii macquarii TaxID=1129001 RepID=UPI00352A7E3F